MPRVNYYIDTYSKIADNAKIVFLNAGEDPWQYAGMLPSLVPEGVTYVSYLIDCQNCGHCIDLSTPTASDPPILTQTRQKIVNQLATWLGVTPALEEAKQISFLYE